jgi:hypothetical protein
MLVELSGEPFDAAEEGRRQPSFGFGGLRHRQQPLIAKERDPAIGPRIELRQRPDQRVAVISERSARGGMQSGNQLRGMALDLGRNDTPVVVEVVHDEEVRLSQMHCEDRQV